MKINGSMFFNSYFSLEEWEKNQKLPIFPKIN